MLRSVPRFREEEEEIWTFENAAFDPAPAEDEDRGAKSRGKNEESLRDVWAAV